MKKPQEDHVREIEDQIRIRGGVKFFIAHSIPLIKNKKKKK